MALSPLRIAGIATLFVAFFLSFLVSISLPTIRTLEFARITLPNAKFLSSNGNISFFQEVRFGIWAFCQYDTDGKRQCSPTGHGYTWFGISSINQSGRITGILVQPLKASWTRGLAIHPVATAFAFIAFCLVFTKRTLLPLLFTALAAVLTLLAFAVDIALYAEVHHLVANVQNQGAVSTTGPGFWLTFVSLILLIVAGVTNLISHRNEAYPEYPSYPMSSAKPSWLGFLKK
ncbi:hypothetical protein BT96DRAFT_918583 [Gymnopus androsaceus JB14]|uniref:Pali-domain-containing protein n=1 Tax=Gymnopus androsaceus JB14 TaxID=1447944 RepID=A0A6A4HVE1_9AGAR|nr:hypothetical protein BT96DRAFT_918583 [Gymnopus androsaceus JB14]